MYKVFVNDKPIILTDSLKKNNNFPVFLFKDLVLDELIYRLKKGSIKGANLFAPNLEQSWNAFKQNFKVIKAGGGLVLNDEKEALFIFRGGKWDLPKGRIEQGENIEETAVREVEEECGISDVFIDSFLITTYHLFFQNGENRLKETHWYLMNTTYKGTLTPQLEEGITEVVFKNQPESEKALEDTYANIILVYKEHFANSSL